MLDMKGRPCPMSTSQHPDINLADIHRAPMSSVPTSNMVTAEYLPTSFLETHTAAEAGPHKTNTDDLDLTLSALKDCDKDFSKFVQEVENNVGTSQNK